jgi:hypothetical protein
MMELFVLLGDAGYDGLEVLGVYESRDLALEAGESYAGDYEFEGFVVERRLVGAPAQEGFLESFRERV